MKKLCSLLLALVLLAGCALGESAPEFRRMGDAALLPYLENSLYEQLVSDLDSSDYFVENVQAVYISQEYLDELAFNSQENVYFGYTLSELNAQFQGEKYIFTLGENNETVVVPWTDYDDAYDRVIRNVAIGTGVILVCVTVSVVSAGVGAPAVSMIFAMAAKDSAVGGLLGAERFEPGREFRVLQRENRDGDQRRILRTVDRRGGHGNARGHLHDRQQRVQPVQGARLDRNAHHGQRSHRGHHARQVRRAAGPGDDHADTARLGRLGILAQQIGRTGGAYDALFEIDTELFERGDGVGHHLVIAHRAHNHAYFHMNSFFISLKTRLLSGRRTGAGTPRPASAPESRLSDG